MTEAGRRSSLEIMNAVSAAVISFADEQSYTEYVIEVRPRPNEPAYIVRHRFSDFLKLHAQLKLPIAFPCGKKWFHPRSVKQDRVSRFDAYLKSLVISQQLGGPLGAFLQLPAQEKQPAAPPPSAPSAAPTGLRAKLGEVVGIHSDEEWEAAKRATLAPAAPGERKLAMVVDFTAVWCGPCQKIAPVYTALAAKYADRTLCVKVDVDELEEVAMECEVQGMPTFARFVDGQLVEAFSGAKEAELEKLIATGA